jgi:hypothetical protein
VHPEVGRVRRVQPRLAPRHVRVANGWVARKGRSPAGSQLQAPGSIQRPSEAPDIETLGPEIVTEDTVPVASVRPLPLSQGRPKRAPDFGPTGSSDVPEWAG